MQKDLFPYPLSDSHEVAHEDQDCLQSIAVLIVYQEFVIIDKQCSFMVAGQQRERHASMPWGPLQHDTAVCVCVYFTMTFL